MGSKLFEIAKGTFIIHIRFPNKSIWEGIQNLSQNKFGTGKSFSEALILAVTNPKYDKRLFLELQVQYMTIPSSEHVKNMLCT